MKVKIYYNKIIYFHLPKDWYELLSDNLNYKVFGNNVQERIDVIVKRFHDENVLTEEFYKIIDININNKQNYKPSSINSKYNSVSST